MKKPNITEGEWTSGTRYPCRVFAGNRDIALTCDHRDEGGDERSEQIANAQAIAALPQVLDALAAALPFLYDEYENRRDAGELPEYSEPARLALESARAALLKAGYTE